MLFRSLCAHVLAAALLLLTTGQAAYAGLVSTEQARAESARATLLSDVQGKLAADNVRAAFARLGVPEDQVAQRVAALTDAELAQIDAELDKLPKGAGVIEVVGVVFIVLLVLELVGVIDIFNSI
jgi:hypothetical protein